MPYTKNYRRHHIHEFIKDMIPYVKEKGDLNYAICELVGELCLRDGGIGYTSTSNWIDCVHDAEQELRRRLLNPYEDLKIKENGDISSFIKLLEKLNA